MHILQIISGYRVNGAVTYVNFLTQRLIAEGYRVSILHRDTKWLVEQDLPGVQYIHSEMDRTPGELRRISDWIRDNQVDLVHSHMSRAHFFGVLLKLVCGVPVVASAHNCRFQLHWMLNDFVIANSQSTLDYQRRVNFVSRKKSDLAYCFTDLERFRNVTSEHTAETRRQLRVNDSDFLVGVVGQIGPRKGQKELFGCLPVLFEKIPNLKIVLLGQFKRADPYVRKMRTMQIKNNWSGRIRWLGMRSNVQDYMNAFDLCVVPSIREPLGLVALESLAAGTAVVATRTGGLPELVTHGENGMLVPPGDRRQLTDAILRMWADPAMRNQMGDCGKAMVEKRFRPDLLTRKITDTYEQIFRSCGHRGRGHRDHEQVRC